MAVITDASNAFPGMGLSMIPLTSEPQPRSLSTRFYRRVGLLCTKQTVQKNQRTNLQLLADLLVTVAPSAATLAKTELVSNGYGSSLISFTFDLLYKRVVFRFVKKPARTLSAYFLSAFLYFALTSCWLKYPQHIKTNFG